MNQKIIELLKYILLAIIQGVGEILPISSSGHLLVVKKLIGISFTGVGLEIFLHLSSLLALFVFYRKIIYKLFKGFFAYLFKKDKTYFRDFVFVRGMIIALVPTCIVGYFFNDYLDYFLEYSFLVGFFLILNGLNLWLIRNKETNLNVEDLSFKSFFKIGLGQCLGLIPGFSRSGSALSMCYREKLNKEDSEQFTFLMLFPLVLGSCILNIGDFQIIKEDIIPLIISFFITFLFTLISLSFLKRIIKSNKFYYFSFYCVLLGVIILFL